MLHAEAAVGAEFSSARPTDPKREENTQKGNAAAGNVGSREGLAGSARRKDSGKGRCLLDAAGAAKQIQTCLVMRRTLVSPQQALVLHPRT